MISTKLEVPFQPFSSSLNVISQISGHIHPSLMAKMWDLEHFLYRSIITHDIESYSVLLDPYKIYYINPNEIEYISPRRFSDELDKRWPMGRISKEDWDPLEYPLVDYWIFKWMVKRYGQAQSWTETLNLECVRKRLENSDQLSNARKALHERFFELDDLYSNLKTKGYKSQRELAMTGKNPRGFKDIMKNEIAIDIGPNGEKLAISGFHRLGMLQSLDIDQIPVVIVSRHHNYTVGDQCI